MMIASTRKVALSLAIVASDSLLGACADKPGSKGWCEDMSAKSKGEWTGDEAKTYAAHCVLESTPLAARPGATTCKRRPKENGRLSKWLTMPGTAW